MSFGGWGGGRFVKVGFCVEGCTDWHTQRKWLAFMVIEENTIANFAQERGFVIMVDGNTIV